MLAHYTVKEYLLSSRCAQGRVQEYAVHLPEAHAVLARSLIQYLLTVNDGRPLYWSQKIEEADKHGYVNQYGLSRKVLIANIYAYP